MAIVPVRARTQAITASDLSSLVIARAQTRDRPFAEVWDMCSRRLRATAESGLSYCVYTVPIFLPGQPLYDASECAVFIADVLRRNGFVVGVQGRSVAVSWQPLSVTSLQSVPIPTMMQSISHNNPQIMSQNLQNLQNPQNPQNPQVNSQNPQVNSQVNSQVNHRPSGVRIVPAPSVVPTTSFRSIASWARARLDPLDNALMSTNTKERKRQAPSAVKGVSRVRRSS